MESFPFFLRSPFLISRGPAFSRLKKIFLSGSPPPFPHLPPQHSSFPVDKERITTFSFLSRGDHFPPLRLPFFDMGLFSYPFVAGDVLSLCPRPPPPPPPRAQKSKYFALTPYSSLSDGDFSTTLPVFPPALTSGPRRRVTGTPSTLFLITIGAISPLKRHETAESFPR